MPKRPDPILDPLNDPANPSPFPFERGEMTVENYLLRLLISLVVEHKGELRIPAHTVLSIDPKSALVRTVDSQRGEIVLRFGSKHSEVYFLPGDKSVAEVDRREVGELLRWSPRNQEVEQDQSGNQEPWTAAPTYDPRMVPDLPPSTRIVQRADSTAFQNVPESRYPTPNSELESMPDLTRPSSRRAVLNDMRTFLIESQQKEVKEKEAKAKGMIERNRTANLPFRVSKSGKP